jgi:type III pantothenate kinase
MIFLMNVGNTHTQTAVYRDGRINDIQTVKTSEVSNKILPDGIPAAATTVVPSVRELLSGEKIFWLDASVKTGLDMSRIDGRTVGGDRVANAIYLAATQPSTAVCIDFGTAITFEIVDEKIFYGGFILPGRQLLRRALHEHTSQLPLLPLAQDLPEVLCGINTENAMRIGIDGGAVGAVKELMSRVKKMFTGKTVKFIGIGGDSAFFIKAIQEIEFGGNDCTLNGIRIARELNVI